jgi:phosphohistidine phosphatase SixA
MVAAWVIAPPIAAAVAQESTTVILVRHAERAGTAGDSDLSSAGRERAAALAAALADARVAGIITTQYRRTRETAEQLARAIGVTPEVMAAGAGVTTADHVAAVAARVRTGFAGRTVLVVGHSNTVPAIVAALGGPAPPQMCEAEYSTMFVLTLRADGVSLVRARYGVPDPPGAGDCAAEPRMRQP